MNKFDRRGFIKLAGLGGGIVFASTLGRGLGLNALGSVLDYWIMQMEKLKTTFTSSNSRIPTGVLPVQK